MRRQHMPVSRSPTATPSTRSPAVKIPYRCWDPGFAYTPPAKLSRLGDSTAAVAPTTAHILGYGRASTNDQDLTAQPHGLAALGVPVERIYVDHGLTGRNKERPGLGETVTFGAIWRRFVIAKWRPEHGARAWPNPSVSYPWGFEAQRFRDTESG